MIEVSIRDELVQIRLLLEQMLKAIGNLPRTTSGPPEEGPRLTSVR